MNKDHLYQSWITLKGATGASLTVIQPTHQWLDIGEEDSAVLRAEIREITSGLTLAIQTGPCVSGPWTELAGYNSNSATKSSLVVSTDPDADNLLQRYVRWSIDPSGVGAGAWTATFQLSTRCGQPRTVGNGREAWAHSGDVQPWTALVGGTAASGVNAIVPLESYWIDTEGQQKLTLDAEILDCVNATLSLQRAMSPEGPWTSLSDVSPTTYCLHSIVVESSNSASYKMGRYIRWSVESIQATWQICFRINAKSWP